jgi:hypothetical protein
MAGLGGETERKMSGVPSRWEPFDFLPELQNDKQVNRGGFLERTGKKTQKNE